MTAAREYSGTVHDLPLTKPQLALLHTARRQLGWDEETYRDIVERFCGERSAKCLTQRQFDGLIEHIQECGFVLSPAPRYQRATPPEAGPKPTPHQLSHLRGLFRELGWPETPRQRALCDRTIKTPWPQTQAQASIMIECVKAMIRRSETTTEEQAP